MTVPMLMMPPPAVQTRFSDWPFAVKSILGFWLFYALTVVVRAFLGSDPWTTVENKLVVVSIGIVINVLIYLAISGLSSASSIRRKAVIAGVSAAIGSLVLGATVVMTEDLMRESREEFRFQAREGFTVDRAGQPAQDRAHGRRAARVDHAQGSRTRSNEALPLRARHRRSPGCSSTSAGAHSTSRTRRRPRHSVPNAASPMPKAQPRRRRSARCDTRSIRTSCSIR